MIRMSSVLRRRTGTAPGVGLLAEREAVAGRFTFPGRDGPSGDIEATHPLSQWRDRAGLSPASLSCPSRTPEASLVIAQDSSPALPRRGRPRDTLACLGAHYGPNREAGANPARSRHCERGRRFTCHSATSAGEGEAARRILFCTFRVRRPAQAHRRLAFCGEQKVSPGSERVIRVAFGSNLFPL